MTFINAEKMPRKLKVCFSNSPKNIPHATYRDLGFVATKEGKFDVYSAGGLGNHASLCKGSRSSGTGNDLVLHQGNVADFPGIWKL